MTDNDHPERKCPRCGARVAPDAPEGLCPRCLVALNFVTDTDIPGDKVGPAGTQVVKPPLPPAPSPKELAPHFPQLEIVEVLGQGGMGVVYKVRQPKLDRFVALKVLLRRYEEGAADAGFAERFAREARALARLNHPSIVAVYDYGEAGGYPFLVMEYVEGLTLRQLLQHGKLAPEEALVIVPKICEALQFAHQKGIVHRDIKPENILLDKAGQVKITDFGIAKIIAPGGPDRSLTGAKDVVGTPHYMAPEQIEQPTMVDHRADIYSLGVVFYEMLTGELPLGKFQPPSNKVQIDVRLDEVVLRALAKEPERRYQQASQVKTAVETITTSAATESATASAVASGAPVDRSATPAQREQTPEPNLWQRFKNRLWPPLVVRSKGERVINWPAVAMRGLRAFLSVLIQSFFLVVMIRLILPSSRGLVQSGLLAWPTTSLFALVFGILLVLVMFVLGIRLLRGFAMPLEFLPELDRPPASRPETTTASAQPPRKSPTPMPGSMWFAVIVLGVMVVGKLLATPLIGFQVLLGAGLTAVLLVGLARRHKWAYVVTLAGCAFGVCHVVAHGARVPGVSTSSVGQHVALALITLFMDALVFVPVLLSTRWFFPAEYPPYKRGRWLWGTVIATVLAALAGLFYPLPQSASRSFRVSETTSPTATVVQRAVNHIQPDGSVRFETTLEGMTWAELETNEIVNSDFIHVDRVKDAFGQPLQFDARPGKGGVVSYRIAAPASRPPAELATLVMEGTATGLVKATGQSNVFEYRMSHTPGDEATRRIERHRLPPGAILLDKSPDDLREQQIGDLVELSLDHVIPSGGSLTVSYRYRLDHTLASPLKASYGPVIERVVSQLDADEQGFVFLTLKTGQTFKPPSRLLLRSDNSLVFPELTPELQAWIRTNAVDVLMRLENRGWSLETLNMLRSVPPISEPWERLDPAKIATALVFLDGQMGRVRHNNTTVVPVVFSGLRYDDKFSPCEVMRTRGEETVVWQWAGLNTDPHGVKIRYKLTQQATAPTLESPDAVSAIAKATQAIVDQQVATKLSAMKDRLRLTKEQEASMRKLLERKFRLAGELSVGLSAGSLAKEEMKKSDQLMQEIDRQVREVLTPRQQADYDAWQKEERLTQAELAANVEVLELQSVLQLSQPQRDQVLQLLTRLHEQQLAKSYDGLKVPVDWEQQLTDIKNTLVPILTTGQVPGFEKWLELQRETIRATLANPIKLKGTANTLPGGSLSATSSVFLIEMRDVPLADVIKNLAKAAKLNYLLDPGVVSPQSGTDGRPISQSPVSIRWENVTAMQALKRLLENYNLELIDDPPTGIARIAVKSGTTTNRTTPTKW